MSSLSPLQKLSQELWDLHDQVLSIGMDNPQETCLNEKQRKKIAGAIEQIAISSKDPNGSNNILPPNILENLNQLRLNIELDRYGGDQPNSIANKLAEIGQRLLSSSSSAAAGGGSDEPPLAEKLRKAILLQNRKELHQLLTSEEFIKLDPQVTPLMILPRVQMSTPRELTRVFHLLEESFLLKKNQVTTNAAAQSGAAAGVAAAVSSATDRSLSNDKDSELELFRTKVADILAPIFFKHIRKAFLRKDLAEQKVLSNHPLFQNMSFQVFEKQMLDLANSYQWTPTQGEMILNFAYSKAEGLGKDVLHGFLSQLGKYFDVFTPLSQAAKNEDDRMIRYILSCTKLLAHCDQEALLKNFNTLESTLIEESHEEAAKLLKVFLSPAWFNLKEENYDKALKYTLFGHDPYNVNVSNTLVNQTPVEVNLEELTKLLSHPFFTQKPSKWKLNLLSGSISEEGLPFQGLRTRKKIIEAAIQNPQTDHKIVMSLLCNAYYLQTADSEIYGRPDENDIIKDTALGDKDIRKPIDDLLQLRNRLDAGQLLKGFDDYKCCLRSKHNLSELEEQQFLKRAADLLRFQFDNLIFKALAVHDGNTIDELLNSDLFRRMNHKQLTYVNHQGGFYQDDHGNMRQIPRERLLLTTHPQWMNLGEQHFKEGFKTILQQQPIDFKKLEQAAAKIPRFTQEKEDTHPYKWSFIAPHIFIDESIYILLKEKDRIPQKTLHMVLKELIQNHSMHKDTLAFFLFSKPDLSKPQKEMKLTLLQKDSPAYVEVTISHELLNVAKQWALEGLSNRPLNQLDMIEFTCASALLDQEKLIPLFIKCIAEKGRHSDHPISRTSITGTLEPEVKIAASSAAAAMSATAGRGEGWQTTATEKTLEGHRSSPVSLANYEVFTRASLTEGQIDSIIKSSNFELIAHDVASYFTRVTDPSDTDRLWLARLKEARYI